MKLLQLAAFAFCMHSCISHTNNTPTINTAIGLGSMITAGILYTTSSLAPLFKSTPEDVQRTKDIATGLLIASAGISMESKTLTAMGLVIAGTTILDEPSN